MIKGRCYTNLDGYITTQWPEKFVAVPRLGDRVESKGGARLKVVGIIHTVIDIRDDHDGSFIRREPFIKVELNK